MLLSVIHIASEWDRLVQNTILWIFALIALYLLCVRALRYRRVQLSNRHHADTSAKLTPVRAQEIIQLPIFWEMPFLLRTALEFALFKTYGITTISRLLNQTGQLAKKEHGSKRYVDTAVLISTWISCPISGPGSGVREEDFIDVVDPRSAIAVARTKWLHGNYKISNDDFLYTLSVFIYEPVRWTERYGWRGLTRLESEALYIFWAEIGRRIGIKDIPPSFEEFQEWSEEYERNYMVPARDNAILAEQTIALLLHNVPKFLGLKSFGRSVVICLLEERLRNAMMLPEQPVYLAIAIRGLLHLYGFFCRYFCLPRRKPLYLVNPDVRASWTSRGADDAGPLRAHPEYYKHDPWYFPESTGWRRVVERTKIAIGLANPEDFPGPRFQSEGYRLEELGPAHLSKAQHDKVMRMAEIIQGTPVKGPWSLDYAGVCPMGVGARQ